MIAEVATLQQVQCHSTQVLIVAEDYCTIITAVIYLWCLRVDAVIDSLS